VEHLRTSIATCYTSCLVTNLAEIEKVERLSYSALSDELMKQVWYSVLRIDNEDTDEQATCLVFDIYKDASGPLLLILVNKHFIFKETDPLRLSYNEDEEFFTVLKFTGKEVSVYQDGGEVDFIIYKFYLDSNEWDTEEPGKARRRDSYFKFLMKGVVSTINNYSDPSILRHHAPTNLS